LGGKADSSGIVGLTDLSTCERVLDADIGLSNACAQRARDATVIDSMDHCAGAGGGTPESRDGKNSLVALPPAPRGSA
jgi:hypothetical protein